MDYSQVLPPRIEQELARGGTVLTANQRAARTLRHAFEVHQRTLGRTVWQPPAILAWQSWLDGLWHRLLLEGHVSDLLLNTTQEHSVWYAVIAADPSTSSLRPIEALARTAADAWLLLHDYRARPRLRSHQGNADTRTFERWAAAFERRCRASHYLTQAELPQALTTALRAGKLDPLLPTQESGFLLVGFDRKTPAQEALLQALREAGVAMEESVLDQSAASATLIAAPDEHQELAACARWLRAHLIEHPQAHIAVIHPSIDSARASIDRTFRQIIAPEVNDATAPADSSPWEFSLGVLLGVTPMIAAAIDILRWTTGALPLDRITALLLSPHFAAVPRSDPAGSGDDAERLVRAEFDAFELRGQHLLRPEFSVSDLSILISGSRRRDDLGQLAHCLRALFSLLGKGTISGEKSHAEWAATMHNLLDAAGWAASAIRDTSVEFQTRRKWESALDELATLDFDGRRIPFRTALSDLERIAAQTLFAPESRRTPIQIMGPLESAGSTFDAIWFLGAGDLSWPQTPAPNPLLPWSLQRECAMPGADPSRDSAYARNISERIAASAPAVFFSYAQAASHSNQRPSPMLAGLWSQELSAATVAPLGFAPEIVRLIDLPDAVPAPPAEGHTFKGGATILQLQAACGFRAFAEKRLFSSALDAISLGLDPMERGSVVHDVLEKFWAEVETQDALKGLARADRDAVLDRSIDQALARHKPRGLDQAWPRAYLDTERERLHRLLNSWLDFELTRTPFAVKAREEKLSGVRIGPLQLEVRVDRIDRLLSSDGPSAESIGDIILDYKTGYATPAEWLGPRPDSPQLPLYTVVSGSAKLAAVAFASLRPGKDMGLHGYETSNGILPKATALKTESLDVQVEEWREVLESLAQDFHSGLAAVSPKSFPQTCRDCKQRLLCRLKPSTLEPDVLDNQDAQVAQDADLAAFDASDAEADFG